MMAPFGALQYSLRPSFLSLDRVGMGREQNRALLHALEWRLQDLLDGGGAAWWASVSPSDAHPAGRVPVRRRVRPASRRDGPGIVPGHAGRKQMGQAVAFGPEEDRPDGEVAEVASYAEWLALPADDRARRRYVLLSHHEDPVTRFEPALIVQQPGWLGPAASRPAGISHLASWYPLTTFVLTLVGVKTR